MRKLKPVYINNEINSRYNAPMSIDMGHFLCLLKEHSDAKGIIVTYPNYYGICSDLSLIIEEAKKYGMKVLVDSAHGAHFGISSKLPENALKLGADMVVMSSHKTLASLTQTAYLHVGDGIDTEMVDFYVSSFLSTSPSYMLMCSMDYGRYFLEEYGKDAYEGLIERANRYRIKINELGDFHVLDEKDLEIKYNVRNKFPQIDLSRYVINVRRGLSGHKLYDYLKSKRLQCELSDASNVVLIFSVFNEERDFEALYGALKECDRTLLEEHYVPMQKTYIPEARLLPWQAVESSKEKVLISEALGRICGSAVVPYPPGVPILNLGEIIDETSIDMIKYYLENKITVLGVEKDMITVLKS